MKPAGGGSIDIVEAIGCDVRAVLLEKTCIVLEDEVGEAMELDREMTIVVDVVVT